MKPKIESPSGLDLNPRVPRSAKVSRRVGIALVIVLILILGLFAYGGLKRQQHQEAALRGANTPQNVGPATALGAEIAKEQQTARLTQPELSPGALQPPSDPTLPPVVVRQAPYPTAPVAAPPPPQPPEPSPEQRRLIAAYEREQQAIAAPTTSRDVVGSSAPTTGGSPLEGLAQALRRENSAATPAATKTDDDQNAQSDKEVFVANARKTQIEDYLKSTRMPPISPFEIKAGWEIPAILEQALNSDLPGETKALVSSNVYDTATGRYLLIPQGCRLVGVYNSRIGYGQDGVQVVWNRIIYPDGSSLDLSGMIGQDAHGSSGFRDKVDRHYTRLVGFAVLTSLFSAASEIAQNQNRSLLVYPSPGQIAGSAAGQQASDLGAQITRRNLNVQPTIKIRVGYRFNVRVNRDILFDGPYEPLPATR